MLAPRILEPTAPAVERKIQEQSLVLFVSWEDRAMTAELSLQVQCGLGQSDWIALGLIQTILHIVPRHDLWDSCP